MPPSVTLHIRLYNRYNSWLYVDTNQLSYLPTILSWYISIIEYNTEKMENKDKTYANFM